MMLFELPYNTLSLAGDSEKWHMTQGVTGIVLHFPSAFAEEIDHYQIKLPNSLYFAQLFDLCHTLGFSKSKITRFIPISDSTIDEFNDYAEDENSIFPLLLDVNNMYDSKLYDGNGEPYDWVAYNANDVFNLKSVHEIPEIEAAVYHMAAEASVPIAVFINNLIEDATMTFEATQNMLADQEEFAAMMGDFFTPVEQQPTISEQLAAAGFNEVQEVAVDLDAVVSQEDQEIQQMQNFMAAVTAPVNIDFNQIVQEVNTAVQNGINSVAQTAVPGENSDIKKKAIHWIEAMNAKPFHHKIFQSVMVEPAQSIVPPNNVDIAVWTEWIEKEIRNVNFSVYSIKNLENEYRNVLLNYCPEVAYLVKQGLMNKYDHTAVAGLGQSNPFMDQMNGIRFFYGTYEDLVAVFIQNSAKYTAIPQSYRSQSAIAMVDTLVGLGLVIPNESGFFMLPIIKGLTLSMNNIADIQPPEYVGAEQREKMILSNLLSLKYSMAWVVNQNMEIFSTIIAHMTKISADLQALQETKSSVLEVINPYTWS